jgi:hypothetical protein
VTKRHRSCWLESTYRWFTARTTLSLQTRSERVCSDDPPIHRHVRQARCVMASLFFASLFLSQPTRQYTHRRLPSQKPRSRLHTTTYDSLPSYLPHAQPPLTKEDRLCRPLPRHRVHIHEHTHCATPTFARQAPDPPRSYPTSRHAERPPPVTPAVLP